MGEDQTIIISTHLVHDVEGLFDHVVILDDNRCVVNASMADIVEKYTFEYRSLGDVDDNVIYTDKGNNFEIWFSAEGSFEIRRL